MHPSNDIAFKEWAVVCAALASGRQSIIVRKGGIHEGSEGFRVEHREFWLLPTRFHQSADELVLDAQPLLEKVQQNAPPPGRFCIEHYAVVHEVFELHDWAQASKLRGQHILSDATFEQRFHYRQPGLFALAVRTYRLPKPIEVADTPQIAGCKSWVELPAALSTVDLHPTTNDTDFEHKIADLRSLLA